jgi:hypothetical protein
MFPFRCTATITGSATATTTTTGFDGLW